MKRVLSILLCVFTFTALSQNVLTPEGIAAFKKNVATGGGGGGGGDITTQLTHRWDAETGSGTSAFDIVGSDTGTLNGSVSWTTGQIGSHALSFPGASGSGVSLASGVNTSTTFTIAMWVFRSTAGTTYENIWTQGTTGGFWLLAGKIDFFFSTDHTSNTQIPTGWHHIAIVCSSGNFTFYLDGVADGTGTGFSSNFSLNSIGADNGNGGEPLLGSLDDIRFYTRALSQADITALVAFR